VKRFYLVTCLLLLLASQIVAQSASQTATVPPAARHETLKLDSKLMAREMPYRIILPQSYRVSTSRYPVIYLLHGLTGHYDNWIDRTKLTDYTLPLNVIIVTPEGDNGWYTDSVAKPNDKYESYIIKELIPEIDKKFRTVSTRDGRAIAGLSMGGFGALKFGLKYPEMFYLAGSFSGALGATSFTEKSAGNLIGKSIDGIFGPDTSESRKANDLFAMVKGATPEKIKTWPYLYVDCGTEDFLFQNNREFAALLADKRVPHEFRQLPGAHNWRFWEAQVQEFLRIAKLRTAKH